jgi:hypothetical protein
LDGIVGQYGAIQDVLRGNAATDPAQVAEALRVVNAMRGLTPSAFAAGRRNNVFFNNSADPASLVVGADYTDPGFVFVTPGAADGGLVGGTHRMAITVTHGYKIPDSVARRVLASDEPQAILLPGSTFRYTGSAVLHGRTIYSFTQRA